MSVRRSFLLTIISAGFLAFTGQARAQNEGFNGPSFTCQQYTASAAPDSPTNADAGLARLWVHGHLAGLYQATGNLKLSEAEEDAELLREAVLVKCGDHPEASIMAISLGVIAPAKIEIPAEAASDLPVDRYTCGEHLDDKERGGSKRTELADWWAFAFIQGYKNAEQPDMVIELKNKPVLIDAVDRNCANNRDVTYLDLATMVARAVKLE